MSKRRGRDEGNIRKRPDGLWEGRYYTEAGKRVSVYGKTRQDVRDQLADVLRNKREGLPALDDRQTLGEYLESWH